jgi:hypothetical protein
MKTVTDEIVNFPGYQDVCLKSDPGGQSAVISDLVQLAATGTPAARRNVTCTTPMSVLQYFYPSTSSKVKSKAGQEFFVPKHMRNSPLDNMISQGASDVTYPIVSYDGLGNVLAPCSPDLAAAKVGSRSSMVNITCPMPGPVRPLLNASRMPPFLKAVLLPTANAMGTCNLCNGAWCSCDAAARSSFTGTFAEGGQPEIDGLLGQVAQVPYLSFLLGKEFTAANVKSKVPL